MVVMRGLVNDLPIGRSFNAKSHEAQGQGPEIEEGRCGIEPRTDDAERGGEPLRIPSTGNRSRIECRKASPSGTDSIAIITSPSSAVRGVQGDSGK